MHAKNKQYFCFTMILLTFCLLFLNHPAKAAVTQLGGATFSTNTNTHSFTVPTGNNRLLLVVASDDNALDITSVTYGATPMIQRAEHNDGFAVDSIWTLSLGASGVSTTQTITVTSSGTTPNNLSFIAAIAFQGVSQSNPISGIQMVDSNMIPSNSTLNIASSNESVVFDVFDTFTSVMNGNTVTPGASQTIIHNVGTLPLQSGGFGYYRTSIRPGAAVVPMSWTTTNGENLIHIAFSIDAQTLAAGVSVSGRVLTANGKGIVNSLVKLTDLKGIVRQTRTNSFGYYNFSDVEAGGTYFLEVIGKRHTFAKPLRVIQILDNISNEDFIAEPE